MPPLRSSFQKVTHLAQPFRVCSGCRLSYPLNTFDRSRTSTGGRMWRCRACRNAHQRVVRQTRGGDQISKRYEKTPNGFLMRAYRNMTSRVTGVQKQRAHLYAGLPQLSREEFYQWAKGNSDFWHLFRLWVASGYNQKLTPSVNRIDPDQGYLLGNIEWLTHSLNSGLARHSQDAVFQRIFSAAA